MDVSNKDIYSYIVNLADDRTVLNMLSVNRKFSDDSYFREILEKRYPLLLKYKEEDESYKHFYLAMVKYMAKLWEEFQIPYIPSKDFNPEELYREFGKPRIYSISLYDAAEIGDVKLAQYLIDKGARINAVTFKVAETSGSIDIIKFLLSKHPPPYGWIKGAIKRAKENNNNKLVDFLSELKEVEN